MQVHPLMIKVAINGFGRIGRNFFKLAFREPDIEIVAINDIAPLATLSHLLKYDSIHGIFEEDVTHVLNDTEADYSGDLIINHTKIPVFHQADITKMSWHNVQPDIVIECSGKYKTKALLEHHLQAGAKRVILSVPPQDTQIKMVVLGVNDYIINGTETIISNASCTTNNAAPLIKVIHSLAQVEQAYITTVHSYTSDQSLHDQPHPDLRRARAASQNIVPTTTGAAKALTHIFPDLANVIGGCGIRVPVPNGSLTDITFNVKRATNINEVNTAFKQAAQDELKGILEYSELPLVSTDILGNQHSCIYDAQMTSVIGKMVKIISWYDNEIGYSSRLIDLIKFFVRK